MDPAQFVSALLAIIVIDIVLAGDNAIVIALAARSLPAHLQKRAILWGAVGAIGVRSLMTLIVVWLLQIPGLLLAGGALLIWIAYRLLLPDSDEGATHGSAATTFWGAMRTIVIADAVMGLDNVLAVAGAAHGSYLLVVTGLAISVPIVVWGSTLVLKVVERYPGVVYFGAGVLVWTAVKMINAEPLTKPWVAETPALAWLMYLAIPLVLWAGFVRNHRHLESRIHARLTAFKAQLPQGASATAVSATAEPPLAQPQAMQPEAMQSESVQSTAAQTEAAQTEGELAMLKVLVPVDASPNALRAVRHAIAEYLLNVQPRLSRHIARFVSRHDREVWHQDSADAAMASAVALLTQAGVPYVSHWAVGDRATQICLSAKRLGAHHIVMSTARKNSITRMLEDSTTNRVLENTPVPVEVVAGDAVSKWERWGLPAGVLGVAGGLVLWAAE